MEQKIFSASLGELIRQVMAECRERGQLIKNIVDAMVEANSEIFVFQTGQINKI